MAYVRQVRKLAAWKFITRATNTPYTRVDKSYLRVKYTSALRKDKTVSSQSYPVWL